MEIQLVAVQCYLHKPLSRCSGSSRMGDSKPHINPSQNVFILMAPNDCNMGIAASCPQGSSVALAVNELWALQTPDSSILVANEDEWDIRNNGISGRGGKLSDGRYERPTVASSLQTGTSGGSFSPSLLI